MSWKYGKKLSVFRQIRGHWTKQKEERYWPNVLQGAAETGTENEAIAYLFDKKVGIS